MNQADDALVFLLDVDNTLLDNDRLKADIDSKLRETLGTDLADRFWEIYEQVRAERDYVDYPGTIKRLSAELHDQSIEHRLTSLLQDWPFADYLYPDALETIDYLWTLGTVAILSDGDPVFQPLKIRESGLEAAVKGNVLVYVHKEAELDNVFRKYPAACYVIVDDKPRILSAVERLCPTLFTTILVCQGKYAARPADFTPRPDYVAPELGDLRHFDRSAFLHPPIREAAAQTD